MVWRVSGGAILIGRAFRPVGFPRYVPLSRVQLAFLTVIRQRLYLFGDPGMVGFPAVEKCDQWSRVDNDPSSQGQNPPTIPDWCPESITAETNDAAVDPHVQRR
jgi:hypothetical protein